MAIERLLVSTLGVVWVGTLLVEVYWFRRDMMRLPDHWALMVLTWFGPIAGNAALVLFPEDGNPFVSALLLMVSAALLLAHVTAVWIFAKARAASR